MLQIIISCVTLQQLKCKIPTIQVSHIMPVSRIKYDYHAKEIRIPIKIKERITTKNCPEEGKIIYFETVSDITVNRKHTLQGQR